jgi:hypothetical protein
MLVVGQFNARRHFVEAACASLGSRYPSLTRNAVVVGVPVQGLLGWLDRRCLWGRLGAYGMCLNHWLRFLPVPVVLINTGWLRDDARLWERYRLDVASGYHPECGCPVRYIVAHEIAHFVYGRMGREQRELWADAYEPGKPSGYSASPEESFCESFAGQFSGLSGRLFDLAAAVADPYRAAPRTPGRL